MATFCSYLLWSLYTYPLCAGWRCSCEVLVVVLVLLGGLVKETWHFSVSIVAGFLLWLGLCEVFAIFSVGNSSSSSLSG